MRIRALLATSQLTVRKYFYPGSLLKDLASKATPVPIYVNSQAGIGRDMRNVIGLADKFWTNELDGVTHLYCEADVPDIPDGKVLAMAGVSDQVARTGEVVNYRLESLFWTPKDDSVFPHNVVESIQV